MRPREARREAASLLAEVGIADSERRLDSYPHELSGGLCQRVLCAIALAGDPALLIADEPSTALDVTLQAQLLDLLVELQRRRGLAILLITHDLGVVAELGDEVLVMYAGQVLESAPVGDLLSRPGHPYTQGLLASLPRIERRLERLAGIPGSVPPPDRLPSGCRFRDRCALAAEGCEAEQTLRTVSPARALRCWRAESP
jgi:oligopeptide/dipeptide ABC transporter ATP-binding protein